MKFGVLVPQGWRTDLVELVGRNEYRDPALFAKTATTVDVASHGRLVWPTITSRWRGSLKRSSAGESRRTP